MVTVLEWAKGLMKKKDESATAAYRSLVREIATDAKGPKADRVVEVLQAAGKSPEECEADVARLSRRIELAAAAAKKSKALQGITENNARFQQVREVFSKAEEKFAADSAPLYERTAELERVVADAEEATAELIAKPLWPDESEAIQQADEELFAVTSERNAIESFLTIGRAADGGLVGEVIRNLEMAGDFMAGTRTWDENNLPTVDEAIAFRNKAMNVVGGKPHLADVAVARLRDVYAYRARLKELAPIIAAAEQRVTKLRAELSKP